jgi:hypothetical protein
MRKERDDTLIKSCTCRALANRAILTTGLVHNNHHQGARLSRASTISQGKTRLLLHALPVSTRQLRVPLQHTNDGLLIITVHMPPERGRASQACTACRKQKTRCYETIDGRACLRCERLGQFCSLVSTTQPRASTSEQTEAWPNNAVAPPGECQARRYIIIKHCYETSLFDIQLTHNFRLERLEWTINTLTQRVNILEADRSRPSNQHPETAYRSPANEDLIKQPLDISQSTDQSSAPLFVLRDATTDSEFPSDTGVELDNVDCTATDTPSQTASDDIITKRILSPEEAFTLLALFQTHYARWVTFDHEMPTAVLLDKVRRFPLLLAACCLIAVRYVSSTLFNESHESTHA